MTLHAPIQSSSRPQSESQSEPRSIGRNAVQLDSSIEKRLLGYAALAGASGVGMLALAQPVEGKVVFTPTHVVLAPNSTLEIDLNGDGISDFRIVGRSSGHRDGAGTFATQTFAAVLVYNVGASNAISGAGSSASALGPGVVAGPNGKFVGNHNLMGGVNVRSNRSSYKGPWAPPGGSEKGRFLALKFVIDGKVHFGWARFNVRIRPARESGVQAVLTGYAYETEANKPIETGRVKGNEEAVAMPGMLGQLALGAAGLVAWRRERDGAGERREP